MNDLAMVGRHSCAVIFGAAGVPIVVISEILRHAKPSITMNTYGHVFPAQRREAADAMDRAFGFSV